MSLTPPNRIVIDFLEGVTSKADAIAYARGFITSHFEVPEQSGYFVQPVKEGYAYEVHEGGSRKAFLPAILRMIESNPDATVSVRSGTRVLQVSRNPRGGFNSVLLPEELSSYLENVIEPDTKSPNLTPFQINNVVWLFAGGAVGGVGAVVFILSLAFFALDPSQLKTLRLNVTETDKLPMAQWEKMMSQLDGTNYIAAMRYDGGEWRFETRSNNTPFSGPVPEPADEGTGPIVMSPSDTPATAPVPPPSPTGMPGDTP